MSTQEPRVINAYRFARRLQEGCEHFMGRCRCDPPFWLRPSSPEELKHYYTPAQPNSELGG